MLGIKYSR